MIQIAFLSKDWFFSLLQRAALVWVFDCAIFDLGLDLWSNIADNKPHWHHGMAVAAILLKKSSNPSQFS